MITQQQRCSEPWELTVSGLGYCRVGGKCGGSLLWKEHQAAGSPADLLSEEDLDDVKHPPVGVEVDVETIPGRGDSEVFLVRCLQPVFDACRSEESQPRLHSSFKRFENEMSRFLRERLDISKQLEVESQS